MVMILTTNDGFFKGDNGITNGHMQQQQWPYSVIHDLPSGKHTKNYGKSPFSNGKSAISMAMASIANCSITRGYIPLSGL